MRERWEGFGQLDNLSLEFGEKRKTSKSVIERASDVKSVAEKEICGCGAERRDIFAAKN